MKSFELNRIDNIPQRHVAIMEADPKIWWEKSLYPTLVIMDPNIAADILRDPRFEIPNLKKFIHEMRQRPDVSVANLDHMIELLPPFLAGDQHQRMREVFSRYLAEKRSTLNELLPEWIQHFLDQIPRQGEYDFVSHFLNPLINNIFSHLADRELTEDMMSVRLLRIFEASNFASSFKNLDRMTEKVIAFAELNEQQDDDARCKLLTIVFGVDNVLSTIAENLYSIFSLSDGTMAVRLPEYPTEVMLSATYRIASERCLISDHEVRSGQLIRLQLQPFAYSNNPKFRAGMFGFGRHACVGKQVTLDIWKHLIDEFNRRQFHGRLIDYQYDASHSMKFFNSIRVDLIQ